MSTALVYDERFCAHDPGPGHPERPARLVAIVGYLRAQGLWDQLVHLPVTPADRRWVEMIHAPEYLARLQAACEAGEPYIDTVDSGVCPRICEIAYLAAGGVLNAIDAVMAYPVGGVRN